MKLFSLRKCVAQESEGEEAMIIITFRHRRSIHGADLPHCFLFLFFSDNISTRFPKAHCALNEITSGAFVSAIAEIYFVSLKRALVAIRETHTSRWCAPNLLRYLCRAECAMRSSPGEISEKLHFYTQNEVSDWRHDFLRTTTAAAAAAVWRQVAVKGMESPVNYICVLISGHR